MEEPTEEVREWRRRVHERGAARAVHQIRWIVAALAGAAVFVFGVGTIWWMLYGTTTKPSNRNLVELKCDKLTNGLEQYRLMDEDEQYPDLLNTLAGSESSVLGSNADIRDPWGHYFIYDSNGQSYELRSVGPDGVLETSDDVRCDGP